ncbi:phosphatidylglycerophosphatase A family protein [Helicobacter sp. WB40]|uniref:phosphatidylglycerophosphatase A family protein n=1 Tax=Helicobacter sp. WB40 TaxID=3004130 RepID=UPI0022EBB686|nr:phosphatidylglycerophosphatase A [Helicobacter sp. WB40]MDA3966693.1 phosphatidylglycerophosphatase A [Helicobacter sp. WB40]
MEKNFFLDFKDKNDFIKKCYLTLFFSGLSKKAPGTIGTLVAMPFGFLVGSYSLSTLFLLALLLGVFAIRIIDSYEQNGLSHDRKEIVIDELTGVWIAISMLGLSIISLFLSFILFRILDIWKPSIINKVDKNIKGGLGVVGDDLLAGFFAGLLGLIILKIIEYTINTDSYLLNPLILF